MIYLAHALLRSFDVRRLLNSIVQWVTKRPRRAMTSRVLIVSRSMSAEYYAFCQMLARTNGVGVLFDRRCGERRSQQPYWGPERRCGERRGTELQTWSQGKFLLTRIETKDLALLPPERLTENSKNALEFPQERATAHL